MAKKEVTNEKIMEFLVDMDERMTNMDERMATKEDLADLDQKLSGKIDRLRDDIAEDLKPHIKALDADSRTIIDHEKRIMALERKAALK